MMWWRKSRVVANACHEFSNDSTIIKGLPHHTTNFIQTNRARKEIHGSLKYLSFLLAKTKAAS